MGVKMIGSVVAHQGRQVAMHRIFMGAMRLELDCHVGDPEILGDPSADVLEQFVGEGAMVISSTRTWQVSMTNRGSMAHTCKS